MERIWHPWTEWECFKAGFYETTYKDKSADECKAMYAEFLGNSKRFEAALRRVLDEWPISCAQFLSNESINRIAWLGQASMCIETGVPSCFRGGFNLLPRDAQRLANTIALDALNRWVQSRATNNKQSNRVRSYVERQGLFA